MKLRVGLIGLGRAWESRHRSALRALSDRFEVRAVCEQVAVRAEQAAREFNAVPVDGYRALAERADVDALLLLAEQWCGPLPILAACDAGKALYCAASFDFDPQQAKRIKDRVEESGIAFLAEFPRRHSPATIRLKELIATRLGTPRLLFCHIRQPAEPVDSRVSCVSHYSAMHDLIELADWCTFVVGRPPPAGTRVRHASDTADAKDDYQMMSLQFAGQDANTPLATAQISCGRYMPAAWHEATSFRPPAALQVACEHGIAFIDLPATLTWFDRAGRHIESLDSERPVGELLLGQFYRAVTSLVRHTSNIDDAFRALNIVLQAQSSFDEGRRMTV
jgi:predicted dehydrogenase